MYTVSPSCAHFSQSCLHVSGVSPLSQSPSPHTTGFMTVNSEFSLMILIGTLWLTLFTKMLDIFKGLFLPGFPIL